MTESELKEALRSELKKLKIRWQKCYERLQGRHLMQVYENVLNRRKKQDDTDAASNFKRASEAEAELVVPENRSKRDGDIVGGPTQTFYGTGGGRRVIRSTRGLGG